jgi:rSAM/selenodomain-associated transferase 1
MSSVLVLFAREPRPGRVKTRLARVTGGATAVAVYRALLEYTIESARAAGIAVLVSLADEPTPAWAAGLKVPFDVQSGRDLGARLAECFERRFSNGAERAVIIGSDNARLQPDHIRSAFAALGEDPVVLGPAEDGGYWLLGQRAPGVDLFTGVPWSSPETLEATRAHLKKLGVRWKELETLPDIDTAEDLRRAINDPRVAEHLRRKLTSALTTTDQ